MEKVLLAIDGLRPDQKLVGYAAGLCSRIKAELHVLQVIDPQTYVEQLENIQKQIQLAGNLFENTMIAASFAESGEFDTARHLADKASARIKRLLPEKGKDTLRCRVQVRPGRPAPEILKHVHQNRDIVLTIYDGKTTPDGLQEKISVPLVVRRRADSE